MVGGTSLGNVLHSSSHKPNQCHKAFLQDVTASTRNEDLESHCEILTQLCYPWPTVCSLATMLNGSVAEDLEPSKLTLTMNQYWWLTIEEKQTCNTLCLAQISCIMYSCECAQIRLGLHLKLQQFI